MAKTPPAVGSVPKGRSGSGRKLDHPGCGGPVPSVNNKGGQKDTSHAAGKPHPGFGAGKNQTFKNPKTKTYAQGPQGKQAGGF